MSAGLQVEVAVRRGDFALDATMRVGAGEVVAVLGRNGSGKSTLLAAIAGLLRPDTGRIVLDGRVLTDTATGVQLAPHRRRVGLLAQEPLLFPHLSVLDNVAFGPRVAGAGKQPARAVAMRRLTEVDAVDFAPRRPRRLSGGQAQRIALARALASEPDLLLLDEPLSAVDVEFAPALRSLLHSVLQDRLALIVTHQVIDALVLADRVVVLEGGRVVEQGPTQEVLTRPRSAFAARLAGLNLISGTATAAGLRADDGTELTGATDSTVVGSPAAAVFSPAAVAVYTDPPKGSPRNVISDRVAALEPNGTLVRVRGTRGLAADITPAAAVELGLRTGAEVWFVVKAAEVAVYPTHVVHGSKR
ncbi:MAG: ATP-binding cassette domain-containing protein [Actinomycetota bacterium]|nr:ATP-binding cassette domain-containing protein [Actinomycetota bacterium]